MNKRNEFKLKTLLAVAVLVMCGQAQAALQTFNLGWSGSSFGNNAEAIAVLVVEDTLLPNPGSTGGNGFSVPFADIGIVSFDITITGASSGNGSFSIADFTGVAWETGASGLDLSTELVGQATGASPWGTPDSLSGDFNVFALSFNAPSGTNFFQLTTDEGFGDDMMLTNFTPAPVPVGPALPLMLSALGALGMLRKRRLG